jgi:hypothetical protein
MNDKSFLIVVLRLIIEFRMADLTGHFGINLSGVPLCGICVIVLGMFFSFRLG